MNTDKLFELAFYTLPAVVTGLVALYSFKNFSKNDEHRRRFMLMRENQKQTLPIKLQAYERLALLLERINPSKLLLRVPPVNDNKNDYQNILIHHIEQEFEHNLTQQIYVSDESWTLIVTAKNSIIQNIRKTCLKADIVNADKLREEIMTQLFQTESPTQIALDHLKSEIKEFLS
ncbi:DUF7935 family protein [Flavobacterium aciduliphilum]|uniref:Uncharacterized protein n=1 Tax=Flavobacterium aciduliphilum TaxID=1101402 RepID=A0A328YT67_9FLAO|nr:hypothetical protein [Flavobacterium aciduliphilum]RAR75372.1 hypothetical protein CLV55_10167 [Flavobacterium aciduliphilum]